MIAENRFTIQSNNNFEAKQRLNNEFLKLNGAENTEQTVGFFTKHNKIFQILAILFSAVGIYFDLLSLVGIIGSLLIGLSVGGFLEFGKHRLSKGIFNSGLDDISRYGLVGGSLFIIMLIALLLHVRSINNFVGMKAQIKTTSIYNDEIQLQKDTTKINLELAKALNNGTSNDDVISAKAITSNNRSLENSKSSKAKDALLSSIEQNKNTLSGILYILFLSVEFFSLFGIFGMLIIQRNTDKNVKSVVQTADKLANIEANVYNALETNLIDNSLNRIAQMQQVNNPPTPLSSTVKQEEKAQIAFDANSNYKNLSTLYSSVGREGFKPQLGYSSTLSQPKPEIHNNGSHACNEKIEENLKNKINYENGKNKVLDLMKFNYMDSQIILALFDNGTIGKGDRLVKKSLVLAELEEQGVKEDNYTSLTRRLRKQKLIIFNVGYYSDCEIYNITNVKNID